MAPRTESDEKYILDLVAQVLAEPDYRWQHRFPTLLGDPGRDGKRRTLPVDGYFPRHQLIVEYWERQHSAPIPIMDKGPTVSGVSKGDQRRLYDQRRQLWARAHGLQLVVLDYRGFETDEQGRLIREYVRDMRAVIDALGAAGVIGRQTQRRLPGEGAGFEGEGCPVCLLAQGADMADVYHLLWRDAETMVYLPRAASVYGQVLVAPIEHRVQVTGDSTLHEYLALQRVVHAVAEAVRQALRPERVYILSLGSQQALAHVQWQIIPCPPGFPLEFQELSMLDTRDGELVEVSLEEIRKLGKLLRGHLPAWMRKA